MLWLISMQKWVWGLIRPKINIAQSLRFTSYFDLLLGNRRILCQELLNRLELLEFELVFTTLRTLKFWIFAPTNKYLTGWSGQKRERDARAEVQKQRKVCTRFVNSYQLYRASSALYNWVARHIARIRKNMSFSISHIFASSNPADSEQQQHNRQCRVTHQELISTFVLIKQQYATYATPIFFCRFSYVWHRPKNIFSHRPKDTSVVAAFIFFPIN